MKSNSPIMSNEQDNSIFTIGHSNHDGETFVTLLAKYDITAVVDVRSVPYSRYSPQFNRHQLKHRLNARGIDYHFMGRWLGGRSDDPSDYDVDGQVQYDLLAKSKHFQEGLQSVVRGTLEKRLVLMCSEGRPEDCHRSLLLAEALRNQCNVQDVVHILADGTTQSHEELRNSISKREQYLRQPDMFLSDEEQISDAINERIGRVAFKDKGFAYAQSVFEGDSDDWTSGALH